MKPSRSLAHSTALIALLLMSFTIFSEASKYYESGLQSLAKKDYLKAIGDFTNAVSYDPSFSEAYYQRGISKELFGKEQGFTVPDGILDYIKAAQLGNQKSFERLFRYTEHICYSDQEPDSDTELVYCLDLSSTQLSGLPDKIKKYHNTLSLELSGNKMQRLDVSATYFPSLMRLTAVNNGLKELAINGPFKWLSEVNLSHNTLKSVPEGLFTGKKLRYLILRNNEITSLPSSMALADSLELIDLTLNKLEKLPVEIMTMKNIKRLLLTGNPMDEKYVNELRAKMPNTSIQF